MCGPFDLIIPYSPFNSLNPKLIFSLSLGNYQNLSPSQDGTTWFGWSLTWDYVYAAKINSRLKKSNMKINSIGVHMHYSIHNVPKFFSRTVVVYQNLSAVQNGVIKVSWLNRSLFLARPIPYFQTPHITSSNTIESC